MGKLKGIVIEGKKREILGSYTDIIINLIFVCLSLKKIFFPFLHLKF
jgi:hypothetical protein